MAHLSLSFWAWNVLLAIQSKVVEKFHSVFASLLAYILCSSKLRPLLLMLESHKNTKLHLIRSILSVKKHSDSNLLKIYSNSSQPSSDLIWPWPYWLQGVENVYTQHTPLILNTLEQLVKGKLKEAEFGTSGQPFVANTSQKSQRLVIVFMIGGSTYEEAKAIADLNIQVCNQIHFPRL